jgi:hypothetical protein
VAFDYRYNQKTGRYIDQAGRFVSRENVRAAVDTVIVANSTNVLALAEQLKAGEITLASWQLATAKELKTLHVATSLAALGGTKQASQADYGYMGKLIKDQYNFLAGFAKDIASGAQKLDGSFTNRVKLYTESARGTFHSVESREMQAAGVTMAKRVLGPADHCAGCKEQAALGFQPIEEVAPIGSQECRSNCHCGIIFKEI